MSIAEKGADIEMSCEKNNAQDDNSSEKSSTTKKQLKRDKNAAKAKINDNTKGARNNPRIPAILQRQGPFTQINENESSSGSGTQSIFKGFSGFTSSKNAAPPTASKDSPFAFLSKHPAPATNASIANSTVTSTSSVSNTSITMPTLSVGSGMILNNKFSLEMKGGKTENANYGNIIKLNKSFCEWIKKHIDEEPICNLMPTFKDYEKYMKQLIDEAPKEASNALKPVTTMPSVGQIVVTSATTSTTASTTPFFNNFKFNPTATQSPKSTNLGSAGATVTSNAQNSNASKEKDKEEPVKANNSVFSFGIKAPEKTNGNAAPSANFSFSQTKTNGDSHADTSKATTKTVASSFSVPNSTGFSFGLKTDTKPPSTDNTGFSFGLKKADAPNTFGFSFTSGSAPFTFANIKPPAAEPTKEDENEGDDDDEPPKVEIKEIVEEDALFTKRCKVFVKKENAFKDHGVCTLYLKPVKDSEKIQLLVRSSNNLGTITVNVILVDGMPTQRMGKNNVMLVHPGSTEDAKPQTTLLRVKDSNDADELLEMINKHKK